MDEIPKVDKSTDELKIWIFNLDAGAAWGAKKTCNGNIAKGWDFEALGASPEVKQGAWPQGGAQNSFNLTTPPKRCIPKKKEKLDFVQLWR